MAARARVPVSVRVRRGISPDRGVENNTSFSLKMLQLTATFLKRQFGTGKYVFLLKYGFLLPLDCLTICFKYSTYLNILARTVLIIVFLMFYKIFELL